eukprot:9016660-Pyramimonas_sp.AAC.1
MEVELHADPATGAFSEAWGHETCEVCLDMEVELHVDLATGAFDGAPYGATKRLRCAPKRKLDCMRTLPPGPS